MYQSQGLPRVLFLLAQATHGLCWAIGHSYSLAVWATVSDLLFSRLKFPPESYKPILLWIINNFLMWLHESVSIAHPNHLQMAVEFIKKIASRCKIRKQCEINKTTLMWVTESGKKKHFPLIIILVTVMSSSVPLIDEYGTFHLKIKNGKKTPKSIRVVHVTHVL